VKFTQRANPRRLPGLQPLPAGFVDGLPVSLQIIGRPGEDLAVLQASRALEQLKPWNEARPPIAVRS